LGKLITSPLAKQAKISLLPKDVGIAAWFEARLGNEVELSRDGTGNIVAFVLGGPEGGGDQGAADDGAQDIDEDYQEAPQDSFDDREAEPEPYEDHLPDGEPERQEKEFVDERTAAANKMTQVEKDAYMETVFKGPQSPEEKTCSDLLISIIKARTQTSKGVEKGQKGFTFKLSDLISQDTTLHTAWKAAKATWLQLDPPLNASFARWVEIRLGDELRLTREPYVSLRLNRGEKRTRTRNRGGGGPDDGGPPEKFFKGEKGKGKGKEKGKGGGKVKGKGGGKDKDKDKGKGRGKGKGGKIDSNRTPLGRPSSIGKGRPSVGPSDDFRAPIGASVGPSSIY